MPAKLSVAIIGAGMGGLTAAAALRKTGIDVEVYEQAPELTQIGRHRMRKWGLRLRGASLFQLIPL